jgi:hypothetical protein
MNSYALVILIISLTVDCAFIGGHLLISLMLWHYIQKPVSFVVQALLSFVTTTAWFVAALALGTAFAFCSHCFLPDSPERQIYERVLAIPLGNLRFVLVAVSLFMLGLLSSVALTRLQRR